MQYDPNGDKTLTQIEFEDIKQQILEQQQQHAYATPYDAIDEILDELEQLEDDVQDDTDNK